MAKILIVDDEPRIRELIRENLQYSGYTCEEAGDGSAALSLLTGGGYDLVILDLMMPNCCCCCHRQVNLHHSTTHLFHPEITYHPLPYSSSRITDVTLTAYASLLAPGTAVNFLIFPT